MIKVDIARETGLKILYDIENNEAYSNISINKHLEATQLKSLDRAFITELVYGTVKWKLTIDYILQQYSSISLKKLSPWIHNILRLGIYQLVFMSRVPDSAAVNESVNLAAKYSNKGSRGFVNAVLRNFVRADKKYEYPDRNLDKVKYFSIKYSYPTWIIDRWIALYGEEFAEKLLNASNNIPEFTIRVNTLKVTKQSLISKLKLEGVECDENTLIEDALILKNPSSITRLDAFKQGLLQVQDQSSMLAVCILDPKPGETVVDVCSAPGGKSTYMAQIMKNKGKIIARDVHEHKLKLIEETTSRLGIDIIQTEIFDALNEDTELKGKADRVLVDAPCSGLGIIRRKPDIKWAKHEESGKTITQLQGKILQAAAQLVKSGGTLVYSTCTIEPNENQNIVEAFLKRNPHFKMVDIESYLPKKLLDDKKTLDEREQEGWVQLFPNVHETDGFFIAKMVKHN